MPLRYFPGRKILGFYEVQKHDRDNKCWDKKGEINFNWDKWRKVHGGGRILDMI